ncbi:FecR family protein [Maribellus sp. YY47]|uniref:FecR family protein n=1 Tax=Maribellus sp. YY47 TaxID=2929486 RepID=UPI002000F004|nr:FecR family protein [Maribellus sp. YY47]MCK3685731.1 FecR family protein [Maribellus sp. YY47]
MDQEKIIQYALGNISDVDEKNTISQHLLENKESREFYISVKNTWSLSKAGDTGDDLKAEYNKLSRQIVKPRYTILRSVLKYAAVLVFAVAISYSLQHYFDRTAPLSMNEVICPAGQIAEIVLADGTHVWLNAESTIRYSNAFNAKNRKVELSGEAFFDVVKDEKNPFSVKVDEMQVKVLGTSFNINAYPGNNLLETTLVEGKIELLSPKGEKIIELKPGEMASYNLSESKIYLSKVDTRFYSSWKDGKISFYNERLEPIIVKLERWYNVKFIFKDEEIKNYRFTGTILKNKPLYQVLEIIKLSSPINFEVIQKSEDKNEIILSKEK